MTVLDSVGEAFDIAHGIPADLDAVVSVENPFNTIERILCGMEQTEINDGLAVETALVEQLGHIAIERFLAVFAPIPLDGDRDLLEAVLSDEDGDGSRARVVFVVVSVFALWAGTRLRKPRPFVAAKAGMDEWCRTERVKRFFCGVLHTPHQVFEEYLSFHQLPRQHLGRGYKLL